jgi:hypothetical protein
VETTQVISDLGLILVLTFYVSILFLIAWGFVGVLVRQLSGTRGIKVGARRYRKLHDFIGDVARETNLHGERLGVLPKLENVRFSGEFHGRATTIGFESRRHIEVRPGAWIELAVGDSATRFRVTREGPGEMIAKVFGAGHGVASGDPAFDDRYTVEAPFAARDAARKAVHRELLRSSLDRLFSDFPIESLALEGGRLRVTGPADLVDPIRVRELLARLDPIAGLVDRVPLDVKILGGERRALKGEHGAARCSYCHGDLTGAEPDLVACALCSTVLHEGCWAELGRCPVLGCEGKSPERARTT